MKFLIVFALVIVAALAAPAAPADDVQILRSEFTNDPAGYAFDFEQSDGQKRNEQGEVRNAGSETEFVAVKGSFSFTAPDGTSYTVNYIADENGFQPTADHLPV